jgi:hypothetical protein
MTILSKALCWAFAMLFVAVGLRLGLMDRKAATTLLIILPILAVLSLRGRNCCAGEAA